MTERVLASALRLRRPRAWLGCAFVGKADRSFEALDGGLGLIGETNTWIVENLSTRCSLSSRCRRWVPMAICGGAGGERERKRERQRARRLSAFVLSDFAERAGRSENEPVSHRGMVSKPAVSATRSMRQAEAWRLPRCAKYTNGRWNQILVRDIDRCALAGGGHPVAASSVKKGAD